MNDEISDFKFKISDWPQCPTNFSLLCVDVEALGEFRFREVVATTN